MSRRTVETEPRPPRRRARRGEGERLRDEILDATQRLLVVTGDVEAVSIRSVADAVGVTPPSIYLHFADKSDLIFAVCERYWIRFDEVQERAAAEAPPDPVERLKARGRAYVRFGLENPESYRVLFMTKPGAWPESWTSERMIGIACFQHLVHAVQDCIDAGAFVDLGAARMAINCWVMVHGITSLLLTMPGFPWPDRDELIEFILSTPIDGVRPRPRTS
jgi:AcrR family transcriptional regulator